MNVLDKAKSHYRDLGRKRIEVPEWGEPGSPFLVFSSPMTVAEREKLREMGNADGAEMFVDVLIQKAEDEQGNKCFSPKDRHDLTYKVDARVVSAIALQILAGPSNKDLEKN